MTKKPKYKHVKIEWMDAESDIDWNEIDDIKKWADKDCIISETGWVIYENQKYLVLTSQITYDGVIGNVTKIPKMWIKKLRAIK